MRDLKPLLRDTEFKYLWGSQLLSQLTINIMNFLLLTKIFEHTGSSIATSLLWVAYALPAIIVGPFAAASIDMIDRKKVLMVSNLLQSIVVFLCAFLYQTKLFLLYGLAIAYSFLNQFYVPAEAASLPSLVEKKVLPQANGLFFLTQQGALVVGFGIAGILKGLLGFDTSLFLCAGFLFLAFVNVSFLPQMKVKESVPRGLEKAIIKFFTRILEGYKFIRHNRSILLPFLILMGLQISMTVIVVNVPVLAVEVFKIDINSAGILIVVPVGIGAGIGTLTIPKLLKEGWRKKRTIEASLMIMALLFLLFTFAIPEIAGIVRMLISTVALFFIGLSFVGILIPSQTFLQEKTPGGLRGRVFGNYWFLATVATIFPVIFSGAIIEIFGIKLLMFLLTAVVFVALFFSKKYGEGIINYRGFSFPENDK